MTHYKLSSAAQSDLIEIRRYTLERWGQTQWTTYFSELKQSMELLANNQQLGIGVSELGQNYFRFPLKHHVIYYIQKQEHIVIVAVLGKHMSPAKHLS
ncbi:type II toxin-antitoxin system RelE/ParE family toxin [Vibrio breoganii]|uniref:type II toxin-antitoxin system RelE/ParE family toxin n=1 Tax=Vibrio breoganii TaxID=553239 RepID=UPI000C817CEC|nr:type II toxin-antitoxin system RelE/ParE family toxin [Vibrio breoganii]PMJ46094.1 plasmid stabilization protein [Vibrio breoganii]PMK55020.1 plasmid stabilization protein [Vibrio breoganii]PMO29290.1 plasmid stabilization protein [Vibrio breoganii]PMO31578.1 plasmid stabilization protein [Vibrio breoganii]TKG14904.1 type II toxin-antitoxin system RelE/ParE family toxin [Vibrio breoganii]